ncbi:MAG: cbb3-type cytochrome c oxidase subunit I [Myxococcota bacterium]
MSQSNQVATDYLNVDSSLKSWLLTRDHKRIGILYLISVSFFFLIGGFFAVLMRFELATPAGDMFSSDTYNKLFTLHGITMVFFFLIPSIPATLGNFLVPLMIGARDLAFPRLNLLSWYVYMVGGTLTILATLLGGVDTGWTFYTPYSSSYANSQVILAASGAFITGFSSILTGLNFIVTIHKMRAPGLTWFRLPLFIWSALCDQSDHGTWDARHCHNFLLVAVERALRIGIFDPALGGDPILFQHLFWFYSHPAVYIMILPGMGVISEVVACFSRKRIFGYEFVAFASIAIALLGFLVWGHHMFTSGQSVYAGVAFSLLTMLVAIPSAVKVFNWLGTMYRGAIAFDSPMLYAFGFIGLFTVGGLTGVMLGTLGLDIHVHDTYFVVAHFHFVMVGSTVMAYLAGLHFLRPKMTGRMYPEGWAKFAALIIFVGFFLTFFPQFILGIWVCRGAITFTPTNFRFLTCCPRRAPRSSGLAT